MIIAISIIILLIFIFYKDNYETFKYFNTVNDSTPKSYLNLDNFNFYFLVSKFAQVEGFTALTKPL